MRSKVFHIDTRDRSDGTIALIREMHSLVDRHVRFRSHARLDKAKCRRHSGPLLRVIADASSSLPAHIVHTK